MYRIVSAFARFEGLVYKVTSQYLFFEVSLRTPPLTYMLPSAVAHLGSNEEVCKRIAEAENGKSQVKSELAYYAKNRKL